MKNNIIWGGIVFVVGFSLFIFGLIKTNFAAADFTAIDSGLIAFEFSVIIGAVLMLISMILFAIAISRGNKQ